MFATYLSFILLKTKNMFLHSCYFFGCYFSLVRPLLFSLVTLYLKFKNTCFQLTHILKSKHKSAVHNTPVPKFTPHNSYLSIYHNTPVLKFTHHNSYLYIYLMLQKSYLLHESNRSTVLSSDLTNSLFLGSSTRWVHWEPFCFIINNG